MLTVVNRGGASTMEWSSEDVKALFGNSTGGNNGTDGNSEEPASGGGGAPVGPIVGGVVGGVVVVAAVVGIFWFLRRRKRRSAAQTGLSTEPYTPASQPPAEVANNEWKSGAQGYYDYPVNAGTAPASELQGGYPDYGHQRSEMDGTGVYQGR